MAYTDFTFTIFRGDDRSITIAALQADGVTAQNITGWALWFTGKLAIADADVAAVFQRTVAGGGITITNAVGGLATVTLVPANTDSLTQDTTLFCDLQGKDGSGKIYTLATGKLVVQAEVTRSTA